MPMLSPQYTPGTVGGPTSYSYQAGPTSQSTQVSSSVQQGTSQQTAQSSTYIPDYAESPILREAAQYARNMAPVVYQWGMDQYNKNQGNIDAMMRNALTYASPARIKAEMGMAQAGVMQGAEAGRQSAIRDLQGYGIDPSAGRYAALDNASRVMSAAQAAGAGNVQRMGTEQAGVGMQQAAQGLSQQNYGQGYGAAGAMTGLLNTAMSLKFPPLGTTSTSQGTSQSSGSSAGSAQSTSGGGESTQFAYPHDAPYHNPQLELAQYYQSTSHQPPHVATGGDIPDAWSPTGGKRVDDVPANLTAGEFVIPKDVAEWKGQEFFYKLMAASRKTRAMAGNEGKMGYGNGGGEDALSTGYQTGGGVKKKQDSQGWMDLAQLGGEKAVGEGGKLLDDPEGQLAQWQASEAGNSATGYQAGGAVSGASFDPVRGLNIDAYDPDRGRSIGGVRSSSQYGGDISGASFDPVRGLNIGAYDTDRGRSIGYARGGRVNTPYQMVYDPYSLSDPRDTVQPYRLGYQGGGNVPPGVAFDPGSGEYGAAGKSSGDTGYDPIGSVAGCAYPNETVLSKGGNLKCIQTA